MTDDIHYYCRRAEEELEAARRSETPRSARAHVALAQAYAARVEVLSEDADEGAQLLAPDVKGLLRPPLGGSR